jgi:hypothetical protein
MSIPVWLIALVWAGIAPFAVRILAETLKRRAVARAARSFSLPSAAPARAT